MVKFAFGILFLFSSLAQAKNITCTNKQTGQAILEIGASATYAMQIIFTDKRVTYDCNVANKNYTSKVRLICFYQPRHQQYLVEYIIDVPKKNLSTTPFFANLYQAQNSNNDIGASTIRGSKAILSCLP